jgi:MFS family permease
MNDMQKHEEKHGSEVDKQAASIASLSDGYPGGVRLVLIMVSLMLGTALMALDATIISVATPKISTQFQALDDVGWYGASYSMLLTAFTPIASNFYKYFNPKYVYLASIVVFEGMSSRQFPISANCTESWVLTKDTRRRVYSLCCGTIFAIFHYW